MKAVFCDAEDMRRTIAGLGLMLCACCDPVPGVRCEDIYSTCGPCWREENDKRSVSLFDVVWWLEQGLVHFHVDLDSHFTDFFYASSSNGSQV